MGNCIRRQSVHPADSCLPSITPTSASLLRDYELFINRDALCLPPLGTKGFANKIVYEAVYPDGRIRSVPRTLDATSWRSALDDARGIVGGGRITSLHFSAFLQVPSLADMRELLPAVRHVRSITICPGCYDAAKSEKFAALVQFVEGFEDLREFSASVPKDFDWCVLDADAFRNLRKLEIHAIEDDVSIRSTSRRMIEDRILAFCADPDILYTGEQVTARFLGWEFGAKFIRRLIKAVAESNFNIKVEIEARVKILVPTTDGFIRSKTSVGRRRTKKGGGKFSVSVSGDMVTITRVRGW